MLIVPGRFKTAVTPAGDGMLRVSTGQFLSNSQLTKDDAPAYSKEEPEGTILLYSRKDVFALVKKRLIASGIVALVSFVLMCFVAFQAYSDEALRAAPYSFSMYYVGIAACILIFLSCFHQCVHPVVHDGSDNWVDLRNGSSNLCDGIVIRTKARWM